MSIVVPAAHTGCMQIPGPQSPPRKERPASNENPDGDDPVALTGLLSKPVPTRVPEVMTRVIGSAWTPDESPRRTKAIVISFFIAALSWLPSYLIVVTSDQILGKFTFSIDLG